MGTYLAKFYRTSSNLGVQMMKKFEIANLSGDLPIYSWAQRVMQSLTKDIISLTMIQGGKDNLFDDVGSRLLACQSACSKHIHHFNNYNQHTIN